MLIFSVIFIFAVSMTVWGSLSFWKVDQPWEFYIPIILFICFYLVGIAFWWILIYFIGRIYNPTRHEDNTPKIAKFLLADGCRFIEFHARAKVKVLHKGRMPRHERFLYVCNHRSNFDPMLSYSFYKKMNIAFITKEENFKIPLGGKLMQNLHFQGIDRNDPIQSLEVMNKCAELIKNDICSIGVYPEGKRHPDGVLGDFHEGVFTIALKAKCPIVIGTINNSENIHKNFPFKRTKTILDIPEVISYEEIEGKTPKAISDMIKEIMKENIEKNDGSYLHKETAN